MVYLGADHGGFTLKEKMKTWLTEWKIPYTDLGASTVVPDDDYPEFAKLVAREVAKNPSEDKGILVCRSGGGMTIVANRHPSIRAVYVFDEVSARHAREHNDANVATFAADWIEVNLAKQALSQFLQTSFQHESRHERRIAMMGTV